MNVERFECADRRGGLLGGSPPHVRVDADEDVRPHRRSDRLYGGEVLGGRTPHLHFDAREPCRDIFGGGAGHGLGVLHMNRMRQHDVLSCAAAQQLVHRLVGSLPCYVEEGHFDRCPGSPRALDERVHQMQAMVDRRRVLADESRGEVFLNEGPLHRPPARPTGSRPRHSRRCPRRCGPPPARNRTYRRYRAPIDAPRSERSAG